MLSELSRWSGDSKVLLKNCEREGELPLTFIPQKSLVTYLLFSGAITSLDGLVGARWGNSFITSPNVNFIPRPGGETEVILRADYFYGEDEYLHWPQKFSEAFSHLSVIRKPPPTADFDEDYAIWRTYDEKTFVDREIDDGCVGGYIRLKPMVAEQIYSPISRLLEKTKSKDDLQALGYTRKEFEFIHLHRLHLEFLFSRLKNTPCSLGDANKLYNEVQRAWLSLDAAWAYLTEYRQRMVGGLPSVTYGSGGLLSRLMGAFTYNEKDAHFLFLAGIPVWLIRPMSAFHNQKILSIVEMKKPAICMDFCCPFKKYADPTDSVEKKLHAIQAASRDLCIHPDPIETTYHDKLSQRMSSEADKYRKEGGRKPGHSSNRYNPYKESTGKRGGKSCECLHSKLSVHLLNDKHR